VFDVVLFCEILDHLLVDPVAALREIHRVLRPGGTLVLTTPNVARLESVARLLAGANIYDPYSGHGPYGRHNREYTMSELEQLLIAAGFVVDSAFSADVHPNDAYRYADAAALSRSPVSAPDYSASICSFARCVTTQRRQPGLTGCAGTSNRVVERKCYVQPQSSR
jgi:SAM-dependent methyltransferase